MPFAPSLIEKSLIEAERGDRLAHAYLLTGARMEELEALFTNIARNLLGEEPKKGCPDLHVVRPESKSRRIVMTQIRELEQQLVLRPFRARWKVACIVAAERMCLGAAEPANAFLKTLEEPPGHTVIFLLTDSPHHLLHTIRSRCLWLPVQGKAKCDAPAEMADALRRWFAAKGHPADVAYTRSALLLELWNEKREQLELEAKAAAKEMDEGEEKIAAAQTEAELVEYREETIRQLIFGIWEKMGQSGATEQVSMVEMVESLEELRQALGRNMDAGMALERAMLKASHLL